MRPLNHNSIGVLLTIGVPTTVILLGLLWILRRRRHEDDEDNDDNAAGTANVNSLTGDHSTKEDSNRPTPIRLNNLGTPDLTEKVAQDGGDTVFAKSTEANVSCYPQQLLKDKDVNQCELQPCLTAQNATVLESKSTSAMRSPTRLQSDLLQSDQGCPVAEDLVKSSSATSQDCMQTSSVTSSGSKDAKSEDSLELSLQSELSLRMELSSETVQIPDVKASFSGSSADNSARPGSSVGSLQSGPAGNDQVTEEIQEEISSAFCFSQVQSLNAAKPATETVPENFSQNCLSPLSPPFSGLRDSEDAVAQQSEEPEAPDSKLSKECDAVGESSALDSYKPGVSEETSIQSAGRLEQDMDSYQGSGSEQTLNVTESKFNSKAETSKIADSVTLKECSHSSVCHVKSTYYNKSISEQDIPTETNSSLPKDADSKSEVSNSGDTDMSASMPALNSQSTKVMESDCQSALEEPVSADEKCHDTSITEQKMLEKEVRATENQELNKAEATSSSLNKSQESNKAEAKDSSLNDSVEDGNRETVSKVDVNTNTKGDAEKSSDSVGSEKPGTKKSEESVILAASSVDSSASSASVSTVTEATVSRTESSHSVSGKKTNSKNASKVSKNQKSASSPSKSSSPHSKSSSPSSKSKQTSPKTAPPAAPSKDPAVSTSTANSHSGRKQNQSIGREQTSGHEDVSRTSSISENGRMDSGSPICDTNSEASNDSGRGGSVGDTLMPLPSGDFINFDFNFPSELCGRLIGRGGKNIQYIKDRSGASISLTRNPFTAEFQICSVRGNPGDVQRALEMIRKKFPLAQYPRLDMVALTPTPPPPVLLPEVMELSLPEGVSIDVVVSAVVNAGHIFIQQPTHPSFPSLERLNYAMNQCYEDPSVPSVPLSEAGGSICAAESEGQWYRVQVTQVYPMENECDIKYMDYGGYSRIPASTLKQIRVDFMTLPFQAVECFLANITPLQDEEYFSQQAADVLMELTSGQMLQGQVVGRGDNSVGYVHLYRVSGHKVLMINREMVNREVVRWIEIL